MTELRNLISQYLNEVPTISIASCINDKPWACTVYFACDADLNLYFVSKTFRRHSEEIRENSNVAATICKAHNSPFAMPCQGIQLEGSAFQIDEREKAEKALFIYLQQFPDSKKLHETVDDVTGDALPRVYTITPKRIVLFDEDIFPGNPQQELVL